MHLATSSRSICVFWIVGVPQSIVYVPHSDKFTGYQFILHSRSAQDDRSGKGRNKKWRAAVCHGQRHDQFARSLNDLTPASRGNPNQPIRGNQKHRNVYRNIASQAGNCDASKGWRSVFGLATHVRDVRSKLLEAS